MLLQHPNQSNHMRGIMHEPDINLPSHEARALKPSPRCCREWWSLFIWNLIIWAVLHVQICTRFLRNKPAKCEMGWTVLEICKEQTEKDSFLEVITKTMKIRHCLCFPLKSAPPSWQLYFISPVCPSIYMYIYPSIHPQGCKICLFAEKLKYHITNTHTHTQTHTQGSHQYGTSSGSGLY